MCYFRSQGNYFRGMGWCMESGVITEKEMKSRNYVIALPFMYLYQMKFGTSYSHQLLF